MANKNNSNMSTYYQQGDPQDKSNIIAQHQFMSQNEHLNSQMLLQQNQQSTMGSNGFQPTLYRNDQNNQVQHQHQQIYNQQLNYNSNTNNQIQQQNYQPQLKQQNYHPHLLQQQPPSSNLLQQPNEVTDEENVNIDWDEQSDHEYTSNTPKRKTKSIIEVIPSRLTSNRGQKRGNNQQDTNNDAANSPPQTTYKKTKADENNVAPIIYFRINYDLVKNPLKLEKTIIDALKHAKITPKAIKITQNGNLLVYPGSNDDKQAIINNQLLFPECKWCDLETSKKKFQLMVKGINAENFSLRYNSGISQEYKIDNIIEIRKKDGTILNICKIEMDLKDDFERLLQEETIKLGLFNYKVERIHKSPIRCHNCKEFGHSIKTCNKEGKCGKCGKTSHEDECETNELKCINCGENHSCYFKGCQKYKDEIRNRKIV